MAFCRDSPTLPASWTSSSDREKPNEVGCADSPCMGQGPEVTTLFKHPARRLFLMTLSPQINPLPCLYEWGWGLYRELESTERLHTNRSPADLKRLKVSSLMNSVLCMWFCCGSRVNWREEAGDGWTCSTKVSYMYIYTVYLCATYWRNTIALFSGILLSGSRIFASATY